MKIGIMQPYFLPYIGYWQLMDSVENFVVYDDIQFTKKGWIHRNRFLCNGKDLLFSLSLKKDSDYLDVRRRYLADVNAENVRKILRQLESSYRKAPYYNQALKLIQECLLYEENNLFRYIHHSLLLVKEYLGIATPITISSSLDYDKDKKAQEKVLDICRSCNADTYINPIGGMKLYDKRNFKSDGVELRFIEPRAIEYKQFEHSFVQNLSIIDVIMFNSVSHIRKLLTEYKLH